MGAWRFFFLAKQGKRWQKKKHFRNIENRNWSGQDRSSLLYRIMADATQCASLQNLTRISHKRSAARPESTMPAGVQLQKESSKYFNMSVGFLTL
jgi:hypothetical protein